LLAFRSQNSDSCDRHNSGDAVLNIMLGGMAEASK
jgi:hypothetical protein